MHPFLIPEKFVISVSTTKITTQTSGNSTFFTQVIEADLIPLIYSNNSYLDKYHFVVEE